MSYLEKGSKLLVSQCAKMHCDVEDKMRKVWKRAAQGLDGRASEASKCFGGRRQNDFREAQKDTRRKATPQFTL